MRKIILTALRNITKEENLNIHVYRNSYRLISELDDKFLKMIEPEDIYKTSYGTIDIEFKRSEDVIFHLEIGRESMGYFSEIYDEIGSESCDYCEEYFGTHKAFNNILETSKFMNYGLA